MRATSKKLSTRLARRLAFSIAVLAGTLTIVSVVLLFMLNAGISSILFSILSIAGLVLGLALTRSIDTLVKIKDREVRQRERAENSLRESNRLLQTIVDMSPLAIIQTDADGIVQKWNRATSQLFGWTENETLGQSLPASLSVRQNEWSALERMKSGETLMDFQTRRQRKDGSWVDISAYVAPNFDSAGNLTGSTAILTDISERKRYEDELRRAKEAAEAANRSKSEFLANMSHEIRTPLNGVIGMIGLLLDTHLNPQQRNYAQTVRYSAEHLLAIINDILDFSKIEAGKLDLEITDFDLQAVVESVVSLMIEPAREKGLELISFVDPQIPAALRGDPFRLSQILTNLVGNAVKFTERGEVSVLVNLAHSRGDGLTLQFQVTDTGIGISPEHQARLFQSFSQSDASTTRRYGGTGLGLAISKRLVEIMSGQIGVQSVVGKGSTFWFTVSMARGAAETLATRQANIQLRGVRTLVVDDNATNRAIMHHQLLAWGTRDGSVADGFAALEALRHAAAQNDPYQLAVLDMAMPGMDGLELARAIKSDATLRHTRIILLTSVGAENVADRAHALGVLACLTKPVRQSQLFNTLVAAMESKEIASPEFLEDAREQIMFRERHVLIAEDNPVNQQVARQILEARGLKVDAVANGREALDAAAQRAYDAILMDIQMPVMDGYEATAAIRKHEGRTRHTPIIALTANALSGEREKCLAAGMDDYIAKPILPETLYRMLDHWLAGTKTPQPSVEQNKMADKDDVLDQSFLETFRKIQTPEGTLLVRVIDAYLQDAPTRIASLRNAYERNDAVLISKQAHSLKGSSANVGARDLVRICAALETAGNDQTMERVPDLIAAVNQEFARVRAALLAEKGN